MQISTKLKQSLFTCIVLLVLSFCFSYYLYNDYQKPVDSILIKTSATRSFHSNVLYVPANFGRLTASAPPEIVTEESLSLHCNAGRLGNQMCSFATLYGLSLLNKRKHVPLSCNNKHLSGIFLGPNKTISVDENSYPKLNPWRLFPYFRPEDATLPEDCNFINGYYYPCSYTFFEHSRDKIRQAFQFQDHFKLYAQEVLREANVFNISNVTYVGVHVRRGDYQKNWLDAFEAAPVNLEYFQKAIKHFRDKYFNTIFVTVSDDRQWCKDNLVKQLGVYVPKSAPSPAHDLAVLASCNHTIMTYGTFGFWGAYLAGGEVLYFDKFLKPNTMFATVEFLFDKMYPPYWKGIVTIPSSYWKTKANKSVSISKSNKQLHI